MLPPPPSQIIWGPAPPPPPLPTPMVPCTVSMSPIKVMGDILVSVLNCMDIRAGPRRAIGRAGSIPGLATYFRFSFRFFKKGSCQLLAKVCARSTG